jgi:fructokinase
MLPKSTALNVAVGELLWDLLPAGPRLGGTTANYAILSARLGASSTLVSSVGKDEFGDRAMASLASISAGPGMAGFFDFSHVQRSATLPTGTVSVALDSAGRPAYVIHDPVAWDDIELPGDTLSVASRASIVCFGTLAQRHATSRESIRTFVRATSPGCIRVCDVNLRMPFCTAEVLRWSLDNATILKVSDEELPEVGRLLSDQRVSAGLEGDVGEAAVRAGWALLALAPHCQLVAITLGPHGSVLVSADGVHRHHGFPVQVSDTVGAGDAFTAGLAYAFSRGAMLDKINEVANLCGSHVAGQPGATPDLPSTLLERIERALS